jgi:ADP-heptose:LPS heptosyltransferase
VTGRVLLLRALGLGDFLTGVPAYRAVRHAFPCHHVVLAAPAVFAELAPLTGAVDEVLPTGELARIRWGGPPPEVAIDLHGRGPASHRLVAAVRPRRLIVFGGPHAGGFTGPPWYPGEHEAARWCRLCQESGIPADPRDLLLSGPGRPGVAGRADMPTLIHPGATSGSRRWPVARFAAVARQLDAAGHRVLFTGSAAERGIAERVARLAGLPGACVLAGTTSLRGLSALVASARLVICGDTGVAHLASAHARPSVTLFGPVSPAEWGPPRRPRHQVLWPARPGYHGDPHGARLDPVLGSITVADVLGAARCALRSGRVPEHTAVSRVS